ncbi:MAG: XRE family transcriptional regulator [Desulfurellales bacterium]|nr:MAG: XRE family transcriptional regulator [Desulfurellales bacterium]
MELHKRIRIWRQHYGKSHAQIADYIGVTRSAVVQWEMDEGTQPSHEKLSAFVESLGISMAQFYGPLPGKAS